MKTSFRSSSSCGSHGRTPKGLFSRHPSFSCPSWPAVPADRLCGQKPHTSGRPGGFLQSHARTAQVLLRRQCSEDGSADSSYWEHDAEDMAPAAGANDHDCLHEEWKALQQRLGSHYAASCRPDLHEPYRFSVEESVDMDDVPAPWAPLLPFPAASPPPAFPPPPAGPAPPLQHASPCSSDNGMHVWNVPQGRRDFLDGQLMWNDLNQVYVIIYGDGEAAPAGIYTLQTDQEHDSLPTDTIIAFESMADAERYATKLDAHSTQPNGKVRPMVPRDLLHFCVEAGYNCRLEPQGTLVSPPEVDVPLSDWERSVKLREGHWSIVDDDLQPRDPCTDGFCSPDNTLNEARARLERLLAQESEDRF